MSLSVLRWSVVASLIFAKVLYSESSVNIEIVTPTYIGVDSMNSFNFLGPAYITGLRALQNMRPPLNVSHRILIPRSANNCLTQKDTVQEVLARWYYQERYSQALPVIIAPGCTDHEYMNQLARQWNVLLITAFGGDTIIRNKKLSPTWVTLAPLISNHGGIFKELLLRFNWTSVVAVVDMESLNLYQYISSVVTTRLKEHGFQVISRTLAFAETDLKELLSVIRDTCRGGTPFTRFLTAALRSGRNMTNGDYVYLAIQAFDHPAFGSFTWHYNTSNSAQENEELRVAYRSVLLLYLIYQATDDIKKVGRLVPEWINLSRVDAYTNNINGKAEDLPIPYLSAAHATFELLGQVILKLLTDPALETSELQRGAHIVRHFYNQTFPTDVGKVTINGVGSRLNTVAVKQIQKNSDVMEIILLCHEKSDGSFDWQTLQSALWFGASQFPANEPLCGYLGQRCRNEAGTALEEAVISTVTVVSVVSVVLYYSRKYIGRDRL